MARVIKDLFDGIKVIKSFDNWLAKHAVAAVGLSGDNEDICTSHHHSTQNSEEKLTFQPLNNVFTTSL